MIRKIIRVVSIIALVFFVSCDDKSQTKPLKQIADLPLALKEVSGIAYFNNLIYSIEDSGNPNEVIIIDTLGNTTRAVKINNIENKDWEDLTFDKKGNLYIGDFGNNDNDRKDLAIYKINKSDLNNNNIDIAIKISFEYPEQTRFPPKKKDLMYDVEAFFESNNNFYLFTKNRSSGFDGTSYMYKIPNTPGHHQAKLITKITTCSDYQNCAITSAAISLDGSKFVLLSHSKVWLFENYSKNNISDGTMKELSLNHFTKKEAVCFKNNDILFIADERVKKTGGNLYQVNLKFLNK